ncbi:hypothetical protein KEM48_009251 [Puccinia striiformis f. sp. tritici PST-130]|nr:hypothetical protein H4Q26_009870 [Puccinia striiformis f. sp. tritici PST-130]KAI9623879.1 hypothetical protein KEM48_009251 [Puccinia striiformis f. sp. tritici PST-130]
MADYCQLSVPIPVTPGMTAIHPTLVLETASQELLSSFASASTTDSEGTSLILTSLATNYDSVPRRSCH